MSHYSLGHIIHYLLLAHIYTSTSLRIQLPECGSWLVRCSFPHSHLIFHAGCVVYLLFFIFYYPPILFPYFFIYLLFPYFRMVIYIFLYILE